MSSNEKFLCHCDREITLKPGEESQLCPCGERAFSSKALRQQIADKAKEQASVKAEVERLQRRILQLRSDMTGIQLELALRERYRTGTDMKGKPLSREPDAFWQGVFGRPRTFGSAGKKKESKKAHLIEVDL